MYELTKEYLAVVKLTGPGQSVAASGSIGEDITFTNWKGQAYAKQHRKPRQPRTYAQRSMRAMMSFLSRSWATMPAGSQGTWNDLAAQTHISSFNAFQAYNLQRWREFLWPTQAYPWTGGGVLPAIAGWTVTPRPQALHHSIPITDVRDGWAIGLFYRADNGSPFHQEYLYHLVLLPSAKTYVYTMRHLTPGYPRRLWLTMITVTGRYYTPGLFKTETVPP